LASGTCVHLFFFLPFLSIALATSISAFGTPVSSALGFQLLRSYFLSEILICVMGPDALLHLLCLVPGGLIVERLILASREDLVEDGLALAGGVRDGGRWSRRLLYRASTEWW